MMNEEIFQFVFDEIVALLPFGWEKVIIYLEHGEEAYSYSFYVKIGGQYTKCFDLDTVSEDELFSAFSRIEEKISEERGKLKDCWSNMTMLVESNGTMKTDFDYTDLSKGNYQYKKSWKNRYLV